MELLFERLYGLFTGLFGSDLAEHLRGWEEATGAYTGAHLFSLIGWATLMVVVVVCITYYFIINHPRFNRWWSWLIMLGSAAVVNFLIAFRMTHVHLLNNRISSDLIGQISIANCLNFGLVNVKISVVLFIMCSILCLLWIKYTKQGGHNCKNSPFKL